MCLAPAIAVAVSSVSIILQLRCSMVDFYPFLGWFWWEIWRQTKGDCDWLHLFPLRFWRNICILNLSRLQGTHLNWSQFVFSFWLHWCEVGAAIQNRLYFGKMLFRLCGSKARLNKICHLLELFITAILVLLSLASCTSGQFSACMREVAWSIWSRTFKTTKTRTMIARPRLWNIMEVTEAVRYLMPLIMLQWCCPSVFSWEGET